MENLFLSEIYIYPIKSLGGISVKSANVTSRGLQNDRRWMIVNENNIFITQRLYPEMALISTSINNGFIELNHKTKDIELISFPQNINEGQKINVQIWKDNCTALHYDNNLDNWLSHILKIKCKLVYMSENTNRGVDKSFAFNNELLSFADGFPFMMIGQSSLDDLNSRLNSPLSMDRFRTNFVFTGAVPFEEDNLKKINIGNIHFSIVKPCVRCVITTINQKTSERNKEPLLTLSGYRKVNNKILFGQNLISNNLGTITVGDEITILERI